ncbi:MAG: hypothetical protein PS018_20485 [bacterium]|nr:hypothetical protein [bacterium]
MAKDRSNQKHPRRTGGAPLWAAVAVAIFGVLGILVVDHGPRNKPTVKPSVVANYSSTGEAARAAGAEVIPTQPELQVEPVPAGPKPVKPANPKQP